MAFLSSKTGQFTYFSQQLGERDWRGKNVLDFGGNVGNMLRDPSCTIDEERYWCIDVVRESIERGKETFPKSHWIFYDRYSFFFNPQGSHEIALPEIETLFDYIVAYSVFTNTSRTDMLDLVSQLEKKLGNHNFFRANRQTIVNINFIKSFKTLSRKGMELEIQFANETQSVHISSDRIRFFNKWIESKLL